MSRARRLNIYMEVAGRLRKIGSNAAIEVAEEIEDEMIKIARTRKSSDDR